MSRSTARACRAARKALQRRGVTTQPAPPPTPAGSMEWALARLAREDGSLRDRALLTIYVTGNPPRLGHYDHVRLAWLCVQEVGAAAAFEAFKGSTLAWIAATGRKAGYHETLTRAYLEQIDLRMRLLPDYPGDSLDFIGRWPMLLDHSALAEVYGPGAFAALRDDAEARRRYVPPQEWQARKGAT